MATSSPTDRSLVPTWSMPAQPDGTVRKYGAAAAASQPPASTSQVGGPGAKEPETRLAVVAEVERVPERGALERELSASPFRYVVLSRTPPDGVRQRSDHVGGQEHHLPFARAAEGSAAAAKEGIPFSFNNRASRLSGDLRAHGASTGCHR